MYICVPGAAMSGLIRLSPTDGPRDEKLATVLNVTPEVCSTGVGLIVTGWFGCESTKLLSASPSALPMKTVGICVSVRPPAMISGSGLASYRITPTAPALCAFCTLVAKSHVPRRIKTKSPVSELLGIVLQASASPLTFWTSTRGAVTGPEGRGPSPGSAEIVCKLLGASLPGIVTAVIHTCAFVVAATAIAEGAMPGESAVPKVGIAV